MIQIFLIFISSALFAFILSVLNLNNYKYFLILPLIYLNFGITEFLYQEWFDPLYLILIYIFFRKDQILFLQLNRYSTTIILLIWEFFILITTIIYYHIFKGLPLFYTF